MVEISFLELRNMVSSLFLNAICNEKLLLLCICYDVGRWKGKNPMPFRVVDGIYLWILATSGYDFGPYPHKVKPIEISDTIQLFQEGYYFSEGERYNFFSQEDRALLTQICQLLDGLPLALLIASSWLRQSGISGLHDSLSI